MKLDDENDAQGTNENTKNKKQRDDGQLARSWAAVFGQQAILIFYQRFTSENSHQLSLNSRCHISHWVPVVEVSGNECAFWFLKITTKTLYKNGEVLLKKDNKVHLNEIESTSPQGALCHSLKLKQWF